MSEITGNDGSTAAPALEPGVNPTEPSLPRSYKVKVDGNEMEVDENELLSGYQQSKVSQQRMQEAAHDRRAAQEVLTLLKSNPKLAFEKLGIDAKAFAESTLNDHINEQMLTPDQKQRRDMERKLAEYEGKEKTIREQKEAEAKTKFEEETTQALQSDIIGALQASDLPKNSFTVQRMAYYMSALIQEGYHQATAKDVVGRVRQEYHDQVKSVMSSYSDDKLLDFLGDDITKKVVKQHIAKSGAKKKQPEQNRVGVKLTPQDKPKQAPNDFWGRSRKR